MKYFRRLGIALLTFVANEVFDQRLSKVTKIVELGPKVTVTVSSLAAGEWP
jgi:hypothetical protein